MKSPKNGQSNNCNRGTVFERTAEKLLGGWADGNPTYKNMISPHNTYNRKHCDETKQRAQWRRKTTNMTIDTDPAGTWPLYNVVSTSMQRRDVESTLRQRCIDAM